ncbi:MAG: hypothetical protein MRY76_05050 [Pseudomonadales bacterium]|nr:hypothetical protein [Pseudomonadales bacterium]
MNKPVEQQSQLPAFRPRGLLLLLALLLATALMYWPGLSGSLLLDDNWVLQPLLEEGGLQSAAEVRQFIFANDAGPSGRPVAMLSLWLNAEQPLDVASLKLGNLLLHLLTGLALFWFASLLALALGQPKSSAQWLALAVTALWLLHPMNVSTTLYIVQRMTQLMALFALLSLAFYLSARLALAQGQLRPALLRLLLCLFPFALLSVLSKENGALLLLLILLLEYLVYEPLTAGSAGRNWYRAWLGLGVMLPLLIVFLTLLWGLDESLAVYEARPFTLGERLLSETRVLSDYLLKILLPLGGIGYLYHDDWQISRSLLDPFSTLLASVFLIALVAAAIFCWRRQRVFSLAVFWFLAMHLLESAWLPLELVFEHRNYLAMVGPLFALVWYANEFIRRFADADFGRTAAVALVLASLLLAWNSFNLSRLWSDGFGLHGWWAEQQPASLRAQTSYAAWLQAAGYPELAQARFEQARQIRPNEVTLLLNQWLQACEDGLAQPFSLQTIIANPQLEHYQGDLNLLLGNLLEHFLAGRCQIAGPLELEQLFLRIGELNLRDYTRAGYHVYFSDVYISMRQLDPALIQMARAFELLPNPRYPLRQALISAQAGRFNDALIFLQRAREADNNRNPLVPSISAELDRLERDFSTRVQEPQ